MEKSETFAGFSYPRYCIFLPREPLYKRLEAYKQGKREPISPYFQDKPCPNADGKMFYLDSDFMPGLRWMWCDQVPYVRGIDHNGWYTDEHGDTDTIRGIVFRLPHDRGFIPGWSYGEGMVGELECTVYGDIYEAAHRADRMAERTAEAEREYREQEEAIA